MNIDLTALVFELLDLLPENTHFAPLIALVIEYASYFLRDKMKDGIKGYISVGINAAALVGLMLARQSGVESEYLSSITELTTFGGAALALLIGMGTTWLSAMFVKRIGAGYSLSNYLKTEGK